MQNTINTLPSDNNVCFFLVPDDDRYSFWPSIRRDTILMDLRREFETLHNGARGNPAKRNEVKARWHARIQEIFAENSATLPDDDIFLIENAVIVSLPRGTRFKFEEYDGMHYIVTEHDLDQVA